MKKHDVGVERPAGLVTAQTRAERLMLRVKMGSMMQAVLRDMRSTLKLLVQCSASI